LPGSRCLQALEGDCRAAVTCLGDTHSSLSLRGRSVRRERKLPARRRADFSGIRPAVYRTQRCVRRPSQREAKPPTKRIESRPLAGPAIPSRAFLSVQSVGARLADSGHGLGRNRHFASPLLVTVPFNLQWQRSSSVPTSGCRLQLNPRAQICFIPDLLPRELLRALSDELGWPNKDSAMPHSRPRRRCPGPLPECQKAEQAGSETGTSKPRMVLG
jgi:hypothetical protein